MSIKNTFTFLLILIALKSQAQNTWFKTYGTSESDIGNSIALTDDGGAVTLISVPRSGGAKVYPVLVRTNIRGEMVWRSFLLTDESSFFNKVKLTSDKGFILAGVQGPFGTGAARLILIKLNSEGKVLWSKIYDGLDATSALDISETREEDLIINGVYNSNIGYEGILILKTNKNGDPIWSKTYKGPYEVNPRAAVLMDNGDIAVVSETNSYGSSFIFTDALLLLTDKNGVPKWSKVFGVFYDDAPASIDKMGNDIIISGHSYFISTGYDIFTMRVNEKGDLKHSGFYHRTDDDKIRNIQVCKDGSIALFGDIGTFEERDVFLLKIKPDNKVDWAKSFPVNPQFTNYPAQGLQTSDGGYLITGDIRPPWGYRDAGLIKTDAAGALGCYNSNINFQEIDSALRQQDVTLFVSNVTMTPSNVIIDTTSVFFRVKIGCEYYPPIPEFSFESANDSCPNICVNFKDSSINFPETWEWYFEKGIPSNSNDSNPQNICFPKAGKYNVTLTITNESGKKTFTKTITLARKCPIKIPNVFTPNSDGINDVFQIDYLPEQFELQIFNRWGMEVFKTSDPETMWQGNENAGVYYYVLNLLEEGEVKKGTVTLIR